MSRKPEMVTVRCAACDMEHGTLPRKEASKPFVCQSCGMAQAPVQFQSVGYSRRRNYPEGFWN